MNKGGKAWRILHLATLTTVVNDCFYNRGGAEIHLKNHYFYLNMSTSIIFSKFFDFSVEHLNKAGIDHIVQLQNCEFDVAYTEVNECWNNDLI